MSEEQEIIEYFTTTVHTEGERARLEYLKKQREFRDTNRDWNNSGCHRRASVGSCMQAAIGADTEDWSTWTSYYVKNIRNPTQLMMVAGNWYNHATEVGIILTPHLAAQHVAAHILYETFIGYRRESISIRMMDIISMTRIGVHTFKSSEEQDTRYGVDAVTIMPDGRRIGWSVKPGSFFTSSRIRFHKDAIAKQISLAVSTGGFSDVWFLDGDAIENVNSLLAPEHWRYKAVSAEEALS